MLSEHHRREGTRLGFTLLEVMLAVAVMGLVTISIYRFVEGTLEATTKSSVRVLEEGHLEGFSHFVRSQLSDLPVGLAAIAGEPHRFNQISSDELRWLARPGSGLLTRFGAGEYYVTLTMQEKEGGGGKELGLRRQETAGNEKPSWYPLLGGVHQFEVRYFDARAKEWVEKWTDVTVRPTIVSVKLWLEGEDEAHETMVTVPFAAASVQMPNVDFNEGQGRVRRTRTGGRGGGQRGAGRFGGRRGSEGSGEGQSPGGGGEGGRFGGQEDSGQGGRRPSGGQRGERGEMQLPRSQQGRGQ